MLEKGKLPEKGGCKADGLSSEGIMAARLPSKASTSQEVSLCTEIRDKPGVLE